MGYFDGLTEAAFKTDQQGDAVFYPWGVLGRGRVLSDPAKAARLRKLLRRYYQATFVLGFVVLATYFSGIPAFHSQIILFVVFIPWMLFGWYRGRTLLAGLPFSDERLSLRDSYRNSAAGHGRISLSLMMLASLVYAGAGIWLAVFGHSTFQVMAGVGVAILSGAAAALFGYMLRVKPKTD